MSTDVELVKERTNIVDIVGEYVKLTKAGANYKGLCPFHNEQTPSFTVHEEKQIYHCFGCSRGGDALSFVMELDSLDFREALKMLADRAGVELTNTGGNPQARELKERLRSAMEDATRFYEKQLWDGVGKKTALPYLRDRGVRDATFKSFRLGFAPEGWRNLYDFLESRGYTREEMLGAGLIINKEGTDKHYDRFRNRIIFPITDHFGATIGFTARILPGDDESEKAQAKYINTPETLLYHKSTVLYGIASAKRAIKDADAALIVEGNMDVIASHDAGVAHAVAVSGTALTEEHLKILSRYTKHVVLFFDNDAAGHAALAKSVQMCFAQEFRVSIVENTEGKDAADMVKANRDGFLDVIEKAQEAIAYFIAHALEGYDAKAPEEKKDIVQQLLTYVSAIKSPIVRDEWVRDIATRLHSDEKILFDELQALTEQQQRFAPQTSQTQQVQQQQTSASATQESENRTLSRAELIEYKIIGLVGAFAHMRDGIVAHKEELSTVIQTSALKAFFAHAGGDYEESSAVVRKHVSEAKMLYGDMTNEERAAVLQELIAQLLSEGQRTQSQTLAQEIRDAEAAGDQEKVLALIAQLSKLSVKEEAKAEHNSSKVE